MCYPMNDDDTFGPAVLRQEENKNHKHVTFNSDNYKCSGEEKHLHNDFTFSKTRYLSCDKRLDSTIVVGKVTMFISMKKSGTFLGHFFLFLLENMKHWAQFSISLYAQWMLLRNILAKDCIINPYCELL